MWKAQFVKDIPNSGKVLCSAKLFQVINNDRVEVKFVVVSASQVYNETFIFDSGPEGVVRSWDELPGSYHGGLDHQKAIDGFLTHLNGISAPASNLKTLNSAPSAVKCAACGGSLKAPYPGIKFCPKCER